MTKRVCIIRQSYFPAEAHVKKNADALCESGYIVDVLCLREPNSPSTEAYGDGLIRRLPLTHRRSGKLRYIFEYAAFWLMAFATMAWRSLRTKYDIVEVYNIPEVLVFSALPARLRGAKIILYLFELTPEQARDEYGLSDRHFLMRFLRFLERRSVRFADRVITVSPYDARLIKSRCSPKEPPTVVMNVPEERLFSPTQAASRNGSVVLMTHGSLLKRYGIDTLVRAMPIIRRRVPDAEAWIVGEGDYRDELESLTSDLGISDYVRFIGWRPIDEIPSLIGQARIGVVPASVPWLLPNKLFEYVAMNKPVVAADSPSIRDVFSSDEISYFPPGDERQLADRVIELCEDETAQQRQVAWANQAYAPFHWETSKESYIAMHRDLTGTHE